MKENGNTDNKLSYRQRRKRAVNKRYANGETKLMRAAYRGDVNYVRKLLKMGADVHAVDGEKLNALHNAMLSKSRETFYVLAHASIDKDIVGARRELEVQKLVTKAPWWVIDTYQTSGELILTYERLSKIVKKCPELAEEVLNVMDERLSRTGMYARGDVCVSAYDTLETVATCRPDLAKEALKMVDEVSKQRHGTYSKDQLYGMNLSYDEYDDYFMLEYPYAREHGEKVRGKISEIASVFGNEGNSSSPNILDMRRRMEGRD